MAQRKPKSAEIEELLGDPQNLPEIARRLGQFESEEAYREFLQEWREASRASPFFIGREKSTGRLRQLAGKCVRGDRLAGLHRCPPSP